MLFAGQTIDYILPKRLSLIEDIVENIEADELQTRTNEQLFEYFDEVFIDLVELSSPVELETNETDDGTLYIYSIPLTGDSEILSYKHVTDRPDKHHPLNGEIKSSHILHSFLLPKGESPNIVDSFVNKWFYEIEDELRPLNVFIEQKGYNKLIRENIIGQLNSRRSSFS